MDLAPVWWCCSARLGAQGESRTPSDGGLLLAGLGLPCRPSTFQHAVPSAATTAAARRVGSASEMPLACCYCDCGCCFTPRASTNFAAHLRAQQRSLWAQPGTTHSSVSMRWEGGNPRVARQGLGCRMCRHLPLLRGRTFLSDTRKQTSAGGEGLQAVTERRPSCCVRVQMRASRRCSGRGALFWQALASVGGGAGTLALGLVAGGLGSGPLCVPLMVVAATIDDAGIDLCPSSP